MPDHELPHLGGLLGIQQPLGRMAAAALLGLERRGTGDTPTLEPVVDRVLVHPKGSGNSQLGVARLVHHHGTLAQHLQRRIWD